MLERWWLKRSGMWTDFDSNPRVAYYKFLRAVYGLEASTAWAAVNRSLPPSIEAIRNTLERG